MLCCSGCNIARPKVDAERSALSWDAYRVLWRYVWRMHSNLHGDNSVPIWKMKCLANGEKRRICPLGTHSCDLRRKNIPNSGAWYSIIALQARHYTLNQGCTSARHMKFRFQALPMLRGSQTAPVLALRRLVLSAKISPEPPSTAFNRAMKDRVALFFPSCREALSWT